ncbi:hypothetical protein BRDID11002_80240 [Bradyrhizobium diazoefficiens]
MREGFVPYRSEQRGKGSAVLEATRRLKLNKNTLTDWVRAQDALANRGDKNFLPDWSLYEAPEGKKPPTRRELHDSAYWRRRAQGVEKELAAVEQMLEEIGGIRNLQVAPPEWLLKHGLGKRNRAVLSMLFTDLHMGEVVDPDEILGLKRLQSADRGDARPPVLRRGVRDRSALGGRLQGRGPSAQPGRRPDLWRHPRRTADHQWPDLA